jgi:excisionase family DNA binding protein
MKHSDQAKRTTPASNARTGQAPGSARRLITLAEAAELLGMSVASIRRLVWSGKLPVIRLTRRILVDLRDVDRLIEQAKDRSGW